MQARTERFEMRLDPDLLHRVDEWRRDERDIPSRSEAIRRLVEHGLVAKGADRPQVSDGEKLTILMLCEMMKKLKLDTEIDPGFVEDAIYGGHYWGLRWQYSGIFTDSRDSEKTLSEVVDILDMWDFIEAGYEKLNQVDKDRVKKEATPFGSNVSFPGFDGNNEAEHMSVSGFLVEKLGRFSHFKGRGRLNSHSPTVDSYRRMLAVFHTIRTTLIGVSLSADQIITLLLKRRHPSHTGANLL